MKFFIVPLLFAVAMGAEMGMNQLGDAYNFHYSAGDAGGHRRVESGHGNAVSGSYSYIDPNGDLRQVSYTAGPDGFKATGDTGVDRKTAAEAARIAALAPKAPEVPAVPAVPTHHAAWGYGPWHGAGWAQHGAGWAHHGAPNYGHWGAWW